MSQSDNSTYLSSISIILLLINIQQAGQTKVGDLDVVGRFDQDISRCQIPVDQPTLLQIHHPLQHTHTHMDTHNYNYFLSSSFIHLSAGTIVQWYAGTSINTHMQV